MLRIWRTREYEKKKNEASQEIVHTHTHTHSPALPCVLWQMKFIDAEGAAKLCGKMGEAEQQRWRESSSSSTNWLAHDWGLHRLTGRERCNHVTMGPRRARVVSFSSFFFFILDSLYTHQRPPAAPAYIKSHCIYPAHVQRVSHSSSCCFSFFFSGSISRG